MKKNVFLLIFLLMPQSLFAAQAIFAGGCFWCMEADFEKLDGVHNVVSGFTGGRVKNPTYQGDHRGHYEAILVDYNPDKISYEQLLDYFWHSIDPFDPTGQFCDKGESYRSAIFVKNEQEMRVAQDSRKAVQKLFPQQKIVTPILASTRFYPIKGKEIYHQDYYKKNPKRYKFYRWRCGRDQRIKEIWEKK